MTKIVTTQSRQGDVLVIRADIPPGAERVSGNEPVILAHGEQTGHNHAFNRGAVQFRDNSPGFYFAITGKTATLEHPEHSPIVHAPGTYRRLRQRELHVGMSHRVED